ncbi:GRB2-associated-binding protein 2 [Cricetulus griseus]|uniref:GRB2-associated-binding protein 2 n=1 Tax=Cricetulus griseus TaxID=10029 RepID=A0A061HZK5_CRIGR|nr:GRB2-associated-binding protein 2 [Cricetulus griseus]
MNGDPDVLEYYKNKHSKKPLQIIKLNFCKQLDYCHSISTQSITNTDSRDSEENYVPMQNPMSSSPVPSGTNNQAPKKSTGIVNYIALDFQPLSLSPHHKPSTSSVTLDDKVEYVQIDKEKTQALQKTIQEWTKMWQSSRPSKDAKLCF